MSDQTNVLERAIRAVVRIHDEGVDCRPELYRRVRNVLMGLQEDTRKEDAAKSRGIKPEVNIGFNLAQDLD